MKKFINFDYEAGYFLDDTQVINGVEADISEDLIDRYNLAQLEWEAVQSELDVLYKEGN